MYESVEKSSAPKVQVATQLEPDTYDALAALARVHERSVAAELRLAIKNHLASLAPSEAAA